MGLDILSIKIRWSNIRIVTVITILSLFLLAGNAGASPPPAILKINGNEQTSGIGSFCWKVENETHNIIPTETAAGFQFALAITIFLAVYATGRKRR